MTREEIIEQLNLAIGLIKQDGKDWLDDRDIPMLEACVKALSQEPSRDIKEISEIMKCDADAETKCKMISNILIAKPHYFEEQEPCEKCGYAEGSPFCLQYCPYDAEKEQESCTNNVSEKEQKPCKYCDEDGFCLTQNLCISQRTICNKYYAEQEPCDDAISREDATAEFIKWQTEVANAFGSDYLGVRIIQSAIDTIRELPPVTQKSKTGHWTRELIRNEKGGCIGAKMICSRCGNDNKHDEYMSYCPNCGTKMESEVNNG